LMPWQLSQLSPNCVVLMIAWTALGRSSWQPRQAAEIGGVVVFGLATSFGVAVAGYLTAWLAYALGAASLQLLLQRAGMLRHATASVTSGLGAAVFLFAGLYQFAPVKHACLTHCRTPLGYFLSRWHDGPANGFRLGVNHGLFCVGCCWALMATSFAVGIMNGWWMVALAALAVTEQVAPHGHRLRVPLGVGFMIAGVWPYVA